jgi:hypothetical protein
MQDVVDQVSIALNTNCLYQPAVDAQNERTIQKCGSLFFHLFIANLISFKA